MRMLKIKANNMREALAEARRQLGNEATVLHTRQYDEPVLFGLLRRHGVEILVSSDVEPAAVTAHSATAIRDAVQGTNVESDISEIRQTLSELMSGLAVARRRETSPSVQRMVKNGVPESIAESMLLGINGDDPAGAIEAMAGRIRCTGGPKDNGRQIKAALIGPTGVGKTTTAAKLAAQYSLVHKKSVALITLDTYRIGAVEQLSAYARILDIPLEVVMCAEDADALISKHADKDVIIIDTAGRSQRNREHITELGSLLKVAGPTEVHLVLSASANADARREAMDAFGHLGVDRLILTKLDECAKPGCVLELAATGMLPYSYVTYGQDVPDDIAIAESKSLAKFAWEGEL